MAAANFLKGCGSGLFSTKSVRLRVYANGGQYKFSHEPMLRCKSEVTEKSYCDKKAWILGSPKRPSKRFSCEKKIDTAYGSSDELKFLLFGNTLKSLMSGSSYTNSYSYPSNIDSNMDMYLGVNSQ